MIVRVMERVSKARNISHVIAATDDRRIASVVEAAGFLVLMTKSSHASGTDRVAEAASMLSESERPDLVLNVQGDEPLVAPEDLDHLVAETLKSERPMGTLARPLAPEDRENPNVVKVVRGLNGQALYFSRSMIPHGALEPPHPLQHVGIYAYRPETLRALAALEVSPLERCERLEQLRALEAGISIHVALAKSPRPTIAIDTPEDVVRVLERLRDEL
jgi:3-deoxy-manno-octulosonate cytidylyltransferase (CMP-KDO synthetase)